MKCIISIAVALMMCFTAAHVKAESTDFKILTSFYPMYLLTINVAGGIEGVTVENMAEQSVGCLHDYTLRTGDMRKIHAADVIVINGAGMESFTDRLFDGSGKPVIDASVGVELIESDDDEHEEHLHVAHEHDEDVNPHIWMSPRQAAIQVRNIANGLAECDPKHSAEYKENADAYIGKLDSLDKRVTEMLKGISGTPIVTSHPAFEYLARDYGIDIAASLGQEPGEMPRTRDMAELTDIVREMGISAVFIEKAYNERAAQVLSRETGIVIYTLDSLTSGAQVPEAYEEGIMNDARILMEALSNVDA